MTGLSAPGVLVRGDSTHLPLTDSSVDLVVTSPPFFGLRSYEDGGEHVGAQIGDEPTPAEFIEALLTVTQECIRVLKPTGSIWINLGDKYAGAGGQWSKDERPDPGRRRAVAGKIHSRRKRYGLRSKSLVGIPWRYAIRCIDDLGLILRAEVIWAKPNGLPESVVDRVRRSHESWFHFTTQEQYFSQLGDLREPYLTGPTSRPNGTRHPAGRLPGSVWSIVSSPLKVPAHLKVRHLAAFPPELPRRIVLGWSPLGGVVLDPFSGSGTTVMAARVLGRVGVGVDLSADYCRLASWRVNDPRQQAKVLPAPEVL